MYKIEIVEDEAPIARFLTLELEYEGYSVKHASDGREALDAFESYSPDLILLDLMIPKLSGIEVCRRIRQKSDVPIIMLTAKDDVSDKVMGLDIGANDYITKPFAVEELLARIRVALKNHHTRSTNDTKHTIGKLTISPKSYQLTYENSPITLTKTEFDLLYYLWQHTDIAISRDELLNQVWGYEYSGETNIVDVYIRYLRQKIDSPYSLKTIHTIRAVGYMFHYEP